jgi:hypothetical protein
MNQLLVRVHGGFLWMERPFPIDVELILNIIGFPTDGVKPEKYLDDKTKERVTREEVKVQFGTNRGNIGMIIKKINDPTIGSTTKLMACKLLRKGCNEEAPIGVVVEIM